MIENRRTPAISIEVEISAPVSIVWDKWTHPEAIMQWNHASEDWHTTLAENDLQPGGKFLSRMEAKDGSFGFDFWGIYDNIEICKLIEYTLGDDRKVSITFQHKGDSTLVTEIFETETENSLELQKTGWQAILNNFKKLVESGRNK